MPSTRALAILSLPILMLLGTPTAEAKDLNGRFAVGGLRNTLGQQGISFKYWIGHLGVNLLMGGHRQSAPTTGTTADDREFRGDDKTTTLDSAMRIVFNAARAKDVNLFVGGGVGIGSVAQKIANPDQEDTSATEVGFELFLGTEYFFSNHFAMQAELGLPIRTPSEDGPAIGGGTGANVPVADGTSVGLGTVGWAAGFSFYF